MKREPICTQPAACLGKSRLGQEPVRTIRSSFWAGIRIYPSIPLTGACKARRIKPFSSLIVRRQRTVYVLSDEAKQSPEVHPKAGQRHGTSCTAKSRKCFARKRILLHRQGQGSSRSHSRDIFKGVFIGVFAKKIPPWPFQAMMAFLRFQIYSRRGR